MADGSFVPIRDESLKLTGIEEGSIFVLFGSHLPGARDRCRFIWLLIETEGHPPIRSFRRRSGCDYRSSYTAPETP